MSTSLTLFRQLIVPGVKTSRGSFTLKFPIREHQVEAFLLLTANKIVRRRGNHLLKLHVYFACERCIIYSFHNLSIFLVHYSFLD